PAGEVLAAVVRRGDGDGGWRVRRPDDDRLGRGRGETAAVGRGRGDRVRPDREVVRRERGAAADRAVAARRPAERGRDVAVGRVDRGRAEDGRRTVEGARAGGGPRD